jgi:hypothetical protein
MTFLIFFALTAEPWNPEPKCYIFVTLWRIKKHLYWGKIDIANGFDQICGSRFRVQACPGATSDSYKYIFNFLEFRLSSKPPYSSGLGQGFKVCKWLKLSNILVEVRCLPNSPVGGKGAVNHLRPKSMIEAGKWHLKP